MRQGRAIKLRAVSPRYGARPARDPAHARRALATCHAALAERSGERARCPRSARSPLRNRAQAT
eukprot:6575622-Alexandrium_andersonii.AAC.1